MQSRAGGVDLGQPVEDIWETKKAGFPRGSAAGCRAEKDGDDAETSVGVSSAGSSRGHGLGARIDPRNQDVWSWD
jgi:hypothetical protein